MTTATTKDWRPARGYSWPPFQPGHTLSRRHGVWSQRTWEPLAEDLVSGLLEDKPDLVAYPELVAAWARAEARCLLLDEYLVGRLTEGDEKSEKTWRFVAQFEKLAHYLRRELGLTPGSEADLARSRAEAIRGEVDLEALMARGREARLAAEQRRALEAKRAADPGGEGSVSPGAVGHVELADGEGEVPRASSSPQS